MSDPKKPTPEKTWLTFLAIVVVPFLISFTTSLATRDSKNKEIQAHFVELAISILNTAPRADKSDVPLRQWATSIVNDYSGVKLSPAATKDLTSAPLPSSPVVSQAATLEQKGFEALSAGNLAEARNYFNQTNTVYPAYHSASEIANYLQSKPDHVADGAEKTKILNTIKKQYSWHVPASNLDLLGPGQPQGAASTDKGAGTGTK